jgi:hypothetical protein
VYHFLSPHLTSSLMPKIALLLKRQGNWEGDWQTRGWRGRTKIVAVQCKWVVGTGSCCVYYDERDDWRIWGRERSVGIRTQLRMGHGESWEMRLEYKKREREEAQGLPLPSLLPSSSSLLKMYTHESYDYSHLLYSIYFSVVDCR